MMDTPEVRTLKKNFDSLVNAVRPEVSEIARKLFSQNLITQHGFIGIENQMISPDERAVALLLNVLDRIKVDSRNFDIFISILDASPFLSHVAELLRHTRDGMVLHTTGYTGKGIKILICKPWHRVAELLNFIQKIIPVWVMKFVHFIFRNTNHDGNCLW